MFFVVVGSGGGCVVVSMPTAGLTAAAAASFGVVPRAVGGAAGVGPVVAVVVDTDVVLRSGFVRPSGFGWPCNVRSRDRLFRTLLFSRTKVQEDEHEKKLVRVCRLL